MFGYIVKKFGIQKNTEDFEFFKSAYRAMTREQQTALYDSVTLGLPLYKAFEIAIFEEERERLFPTIPEPTATKSFEDWE